MRLDEHDVEGLVGAIYDEATPVVVGVVSPAGLTLVAHGGRSSGRRVAGCDSVLYGGSLAKQVTGACVALLVRDGALELDAPVGPWLPELPAWAATVRVRHLLHHTAGLALTDRLWERMTAAGEADWTSDGVIAALATTAGPEQPPGTTYAYSNAGYVCLARVVERASGAGLPTFAREHLFAPLGMDATSLWAGRGPAPPAAALTASAGSPAPLSLGDGGLWTSVRDLLRWNEALLRDELGVTEALHAPGSLDDGAPLDYAWGVRVFEVDGQRVQSHGGSWDCATAKLVRLPDRRVGFAVLAHDGSVERMTDLSLRLQAELLG